MNKSSIVKLLAWFDAFNYPLTFEEIEYYNNLIDKDFIQTSQALIDKKDKFYFLKGRDKIIQNRISNNQRAKKLWKKVKKWQWIFEITPFVKMVAVCNTLSFHNPDQDSDIDLFIVTKSNKLFLARTFITFLTTIFGIRRHGSKIKERFCLSFWITDQALDLSTIMLKNGDPYLAYWIFDLKPLFGWRIYKEILEINKKWMNDFLYIKEIETNNDGERKNFFKKSLEFLLKGSLGNKIEKLLENFQLKRCQEKIKKLDKRASVIANKNMLKFHNVDMREYYRDKWLEKLSKISISI